ncbi:Ig domain-containing protein [Runella sp.]|uniref:Ig domain-containing protein n=1 Tax=Runella sp. TaxID=1960881 RepID=UPI003D14CDEF
MSLSVLKVLPSHTFANFRAIFNANADDAVIVEGEVNLDGDGVPLIRFLTESGEYFDVSLPYFYSKTQTDALIDDMRQSLLDEFSALIGGGGGGGGGAMPIITSPMPNVNYHYGGDIEILLSPNNAASPNGNITGITLYDLPGWLTFDSDTNIVSGTAPSGTTGNYNVRVRYTDEIGAYTEDLFGIQITSEATVIASEHLWAGMLVNIYDDGGVSKMRPAIGTDEAHIAHGFVDKTVLEDQSVEPKFDTIKTYLDLVPGAQYFLSTTNPGGISDAGPAEGSGLIWQPIGRALSATELLLDIETYIIRS